MKTFREWLKEMVGTGAVWDGTTHPDFNWWGAPWSETTPRTNKKKPKKKKKNEYP